MVEELKDINLIELNKKFLIQSLKDYYNEENNKKIRNINHLDINKLIEFIFNNNIDIVKLYNNYYNEIIKMNDIKKIEHKKNLQNVEDRLYKYNSFIRSYKIKLEYQKNRITEQDKTEDINKLLNKIKFYENKILKLNNITYDNNNIN